MKLLTVLAVISTLLLGCDIDSTMQEMAKNNPNAQVRMLAAKSGCMGCHSVDHGVLGPAWRQVADRYSNDPLVREKIIHSITHGSAGHWSKDVMPAFKDRLSAEQIALLADYIVSLGVAKK